MAILVSSWKIAHTVMQEMSVKVFSPFNLADLKSTVTWKANKQTCVVWYLKYHTTLASLWQSVYEIAGFCTEPHYLYFNGLFKRRKYLVKMITLLNLFSLFLYYGKIVKWLTSFLDSNLWRAETRLKSFYSDSYMYFKI